MACAKDGSLQVGFGLGKYTNRNVMDAYAGISRGVEQWTVRASRRLGAGSRARAVGPLRYEVLEPLREVRVGLEPNERAADRVRLDLRRRGAAVARGPRGRTCRTATASRRTSIRYHQTGTWLGLGGGRRQAHAIDARRVGLDARPLVGRAPRRGPPPTDLEHGDRPPNVSVFVIWNPMLMQRPDGTRYAIHHYLRRIEIPRVYRDDRFEGGIEHPDGREEFFRAHEPELRFDPVNRRLLGGRFTSRWPTASRGR